MSPVNFLFVAAELCRLCVCALLVSQICSFLGPASARSTYFHVSNDRIVDVDGCESFFHGVNVVYKTSPYLPPIDHFSNNSFSVRDMQILHSLGQNVIRLGVLWVGAEPNRHEYNLTYIASAAEMIETAYTQYNITTLVDSHQDVYSEAFCCDGHPTWAAQPVVWNFPEPLSAAFNDTVEHIPSASDCRQHPWASYYTTESVCSAFQRLYKNHNGLRDSFAAFWGVLAQQFKALDGILGFELMNEPWAGNIYADPRLIYPGTADRENLQPFYDAVVPRIYGNDSRRLVFFESVTWTDEFNASFDAAGFTRVPGGAQNSNRSVFSFHFYAAPNVGSQNKYFSKRTDDGRAWNATSFLTEFYIINNAQTAQVYDAMMKTMSFCDEYLVSWIGWTYKGFGGHDSSFGGDVLLIDGSVNPLVGKALSRTYPQKVAGHTLQIVFDWKANAGNGKFTLVYEMNTDISLKPTIIYASETYWYPNGFNLDITTPDPNAIASYKTYGNYIEIYNSNDPQFNGATVTVTVDPK